jgi:hypothetical protein
MLLDLSGVPLILPNIFIFFEGLKIVEILYISCVYLHHDTIVVNWIDKQGDNSSVTMHFCYV